MTLAMRERPLMASSSEIKLPEMLTGLEYCGSPRDEFKQLSEGYGAVFASGWRG